MLTKTSVVVVLLYGGTMRHEFQPGDNPRSVNTCRYCGREKSADIHITHSVVPEAVQRTIQYQKEYGERWKREDDRKQ